MSRGVALAEPLRVGSLKGALPKGTDQAGGAVVNGGGCAARTPICGVRVEPPGRLYEQSVKDHRRRNPG